MTEFFSTHDGKWQRPKIMYYRLLLLSLFFALSLDSANAAQAPDEQSSPHDWLVELGAGVADDSTIVVEEIDNISSDGGKSTQLLLNARYRYQASESLEYSATYTYSAKNYKHTDALDTHVHILSGSFRHKWDTFSGGIRAHSITADLAHEDFLEINQIAPYVSFFLDESWYMDISYRLAKKNIVTDEARSGDSKTLLADVYYLIRGTQQFWQIGLRDIRESTDDNLYSNHEQEWRLMYVHTVTTFSIDNELRISYSRQRRDFDKQQDPSIEQFRLDERDIWEIEVVSYLSENMTSELAFSRTQNDSNNPLLVYEQESLSLMLNYQF